MLVCFCCLDSGYVAQRLSISREIYKISRTARVLEQYNNTNRVVAITMPQATLPCGGNGIQQCCLEPLDVAVCYKPLPVTILMHYTSIGNFSEHGVVKCITCCITFKSGSDFR